MAARRKAKPSPLPTFDPVPSAQFGLEILDRSKSRRALIGRVAMWYWLDDEADHEYTKGVDFAVPQVSIPSILEVLHQTDAEVSQLTIGGVNARISKQGVRADFIDRSSEEWGNLQLLYLDAIRAAEAQDDQFEGIPVAPPEHLVAMKLAAGTDKDERDAVRLIAKVKDLDVEATRDLVRKFLGPDCSADSKSASAAQDTHGPGGPTVWVPESSSWCRTTSTAIKRVVDGASRFASAASSIPDFLHEVEDRLGRRDEP